MLQIYKAQGENLEKATSLTCLSKKSKLIYRKVYQSRKVDTPSFFDVHLEKIRIQKICRLGMAEISDRLSYAGSTKAGESGKVEL